MNYQWHYDRLIERGLKTRTEEYRERHHIIPKCLGGNNKKENLVYLTAEEHYVAHQLLVKLYPGNEKLTFAAMNMCRSNGKHIRNNKLYGWVRKAFSESRKGHEVSEETRKKIGDANRGRKLSSEPWNKGKKGLQTAWNKGIPMSDEAKKKQSAQKLGKPRNKR